MIVVYPTLGLEREVLVCGMWLLHIKSALTTRVSVLYYHMKRINFFNALFKHFLFLLLNKHK